MFDDKQKRLFNQGYGAYREVVSFCIENISLLDKEDEPSARAALVVMCDMQLQRLLFDISDFPNTELTDAETTFIKSIIESSSFLKNFVPGYGKFYRHMTADNYKAISGQMKKDTADIHIAMAIAVKLDSSKRDEAATLVINNLRTVFNSYIALSESKITHPGKNSNFSTGQGGWISTIVALGYLSVLLPGDIPINGFTMLIGLICAGVLVVKFLGWLYK